MRCIGFLDVAQTFNILNNLHIYQSYSKPWEANSYFSGVNLYGGPRASKELNLPEAHSFHHEYNSMACTIEIVDDVYAAIEHIHQHGRYVSKNNSLSSYLLFSDHLYISATYYCRRIIWIQILLTLVAVRILIVL